MLNIAYSCNRTKREAKRDDFCREEVKDVGGEQEVVQGDGGGGRQDARLQLQILLSQVNLLSSYRKPNHFRFFEYVFARNFNPI